MRNRVLYLSFVFLFLSANAWAQPMPDEDAVGEYRVIGDRTYVCEPAVRGQKGMQKCRDVETGRTMDIESYQFNPETLRNWMPSRP